MKRDIDHFHVREEHAVIDLRLENEKRMLLSKFTYDKDSGCFYYKENGYNNAYFAGEKAGSSDGQGYLRLGVGGRRFRAHRVAWLFVHGDWPSNDIDHINGNRADNRISNLRDVTRADNLQNMRKRTPGAAGFNGVTKKGKKYVAQITADYKHIYLGRFDSAEEAREAYISAKKKLHKGYVP